MKFFKTSQIKDIDKYTIENEPISSVLLMERAAERILKQFKKDFSQDQNVLVVCGPGNNGGDGLALARMLMQIGYDTEVLLLHSGKLSHDCQQNKNNFEDSFSDFFYEQNKNFEPIEVSKKTIIVDALFGSGLSRPLEGCFADAVNWINSLENYVVAIDIPSGMGGEDIVNLQNAVVKADITYTLQFPKLAFLFSENERYVGKWKIIDIQLHPKAIKQIDSSYFFADKIFIQSFLKKRLRFAHKGSFGHVCLVAGSEGMAGAAIISSKSALRSGAGLVTVISPESNRVILQTSVPEAMYKSDIDELSKYTVLAIGPGLGMSSQSKELINNVLTKVPLGGLGGIIFDADALNILSENKDLWNLIPKNTIITPHPKEFERLFGKCENSLQRLELAKQKAVDLQIYIILKGAFTAVCTPGGSVYFNSTGNPGMATGGMGDVLTGIIAGLLSQHYFPFESAVLGVYLHGLSADLSLENQSEESLLPHDVIENLGKAFILLKD